MTKLPWGKISELAQLSGYSQQSISAFLSDSEWGRRPYRRSPKFKRLADAAGISQELLLKGKREEIIEGIIDGANTYLLVLARKVRDGVPNKG